MSESIFIWTCRFCGSKSETRCLSGIAEAVKSYLKESGCSFCQVTLYMELMAGSLLRKSVEVK
jgi:hypothetical protein